MEPLSLPILLAALALTLLPAVNILAAVMLGRAMRRGTSTALWERFVAAADLALASVLVAMVSANRVFELQLPDGLLVMMLIAALFAINIPAIVWITLYVTNRFNPTGGIRQ